MDNAGKSTLLNKFSGDSIYDIAPTLGFNIKTLEYRSYKLNVWDVGGQQTIRSYWRNYYECTDGLIFVIDSTDKRRLDIVASELQQLLKQEKLAGASLLIFANKQDLKGALNKEEIAQVLNLENIGAGGRHWQIVACSAWTGDGLIDGIDWIVNDIASRIYMME